MQVAFEKITISLLIFGAVLSEENVNTADLKL